MAKPKMTSSAPLHKRTVAFTGLFGALALHFPPVTAFVLAAMMVCLLSKL